MEERECPMCEALNGPVGNLGRLSHYNCRGCGVWYSAPSDSVADVRHQVTEPPENGYHPRYDNFECHRVVVYTDTNAEETVEQDDDYQYDEEYRDNVGPFREYWAVYGHNRNPMQDGALEWIADCGRFEDAAMIVKALAEAYEVTMEPIILGEAR